MTATIAPSFPGPSALHSAATLERSGLLIAAVGGPSVDDTITAAYQCAQLLHTPVRFVSVLESSMSSAWGWDGSPFPENLPDMRTIAQRRHIEHHVAAAAPEGIAWSVEVREGEAASQIAAVAHEEHASLIVMGLGRHRPLDRLLGAETALAVVRHAECAVLAVAREAVLPPRIAIAGVDFSDAAAHAIRQAASLLAPNATLHLVHVWRGPTTELDALSEPYDSYALQLPVRFQQFIASLHLPSSIVVRWEVREGRAAEQLLSYASEHGADLIVVGRHGRRMLERLIVGSVTTRVLRGAQCSVWVSPEPTIREREQLERLAVKSGGDVVPRAEWKSALEHFTRAHAGRIVALDVVDPAQHIHARERGYMLFGIAYDEDHGEIEIVLGETHGRSRHLTRMIGNIRSIEMLRSERADDLALRLRHGGGFTLLTLV